MFLALHLPGNSGQHLGPIHAKSQGFQIPSFFSDESCFSFVLANAFLAGLALQTVSRVTAPVCVDILSG